MSGHGRGFTRESASTPLNTEEAAYFMAAPLPETIRQKCLGYCMGVPCWCQSPVQCPWVGQAMVCPSSSESPGSGRHQMRDRYPPTTPLRTLRQLSLVVRETIDNMCPVRPPSVHKVPSALSPRVSTRDDEIPRGVRDSALLRRDQL